MTDNTDDQIFTITHPDSPRRILFEGTEKSARQYMRDNFPRPHSDGNGLIYSAQLNHPSGKVQTFHVDDADSEDGWSALESDESESDYVAPIDPTVEPVDPSQPLI